MATVLIVDDRATNREVARATLDHGGHHVIEATEGHQALAMARTIHPDVILTDVVMPGMDGRTATRRIREAHPGTVLHRQLQPRRSPTTGHRLRRRPGPGEVR